MDPKLEARRRASIYVADLVESCANCSIAMGSGSTVKLFIEELSRRGIINIYRYISTSLDTSITLRGAGARNIETAMCPEDVDIYVDSADEIDPRLNLLKGGGAALFREKIAMLSSRRRIIIADETKLVEMLGSTRPVPLEVEVYSLYYVMRELRKLGYEANYRESHSKLGPVVTDNGNIVIDVKTGPLRNPEEVDRILKSIEGVVSTGIFPYNGYEVVVGMLSGAVKVFKPNGGIEVVSIGNKGVDPYP
ncbi:MAG TPA: ribose 5-phosphate isomerase A [Sulfolobales archaeon]|nr:ribose 5-phosphate isomerase A [Sulfolobales archaeon]